MLNYFIFHILLPMIRKWLKIDNMLIYVVILSISWLVLCIRLLRTIVLTWIQIVHLFYHISFYDLLIGWWNYTDGVILYWQCDIILTVWYYTDGVILYWRCDIIMTMWYYTDGVILSWRCDTILTVWYYTDGVILSWRCDIILTVWYHPDGVILSWRCDIILTVWYYPDRVILYWRCDIILTVWYVLFFIWFWQMFCILQIIHLHWGPYCSLWNGRSL